MQLQPRQQLLEIWRATARSSYTEPDWRWGGRSEANSISDAEQLLCLLGPTTEVPVLRLDRPDGTADDVIAALQRLGDSVEIPKLLVRVLTDYLRNYSAPDGTPVFHGRSYFTAPEDLALDDDHLELDVVDSFAVSVTLTVAVIGFVRVFRTVLTRERLRAEADELERLASRRLTAAMVGLLRSFAVDVFSADSDRGVELCRLVNQEDLPTRQIVEELYETLREINARLRDDVLIGSGAQGSELDNPNRLFECGWSWGIVKNAPVIDLAEGVDVGVQHEGVAQAAPYMYFTVVAVDAIQTLFSERTRLLGLLDETQLRLAQSLQLRWELTLSYWSTIATFGSGRWPLEDLPWRTTDGVDSDYLSLLVSGMVIQDLVTKRASDAELSRVGAVLEDLAGRARITRRPFVGDPALELHHPGFRIGLELQDQPGKGYLGWTAADFSPQLLRRSLNLARLIADNAGRSRLLDLSDEIWAHLFSRRIPEGEARGLWDRPSLAYPQLDDDPDPAPSWYFTKRVVDCLVAAARLIDSPPQRSDQLTRLAADLIVEADHLFDQEMLNGSSDSGRPLQAEREQIQVLLQRARSVRRTQPGTAVSIAQAVLRRLDKLSAARRPAKGIN
ncbi:SCO2524 family protein [Couchioplanes caeruleus]|uniref:SCO2524 family protein n=1 Tax=Couchioplanes caeruleus TaxID=56438 RepID=UPI0020BDF33C|nr:SCO2524 family protein [Couchioplanes caeruleus]UQU64034.1 SCO2524 family protein [Couchioplanes caeruleus]